MSSPVNEKLVGTGQEEFWSGRGIDWEGILTSKEALYLVGVIATVLAISAYNGLLGVGAENFTHTVVETAVRGVDLVQSVFHPHITPSIETAKNLSVAVQVDVAPVKPVAEAMRPAIIEWLSKRNVPMP